MKIHIATTPYRTREHPRRNGVQKLYKFPNGWGASVVRFKIDDMYTSYTRDDTEWELAVVKWVGEGDDDFEIDYKNPVADGDVVGHLSEAELEKMLGRIKRFKKYEK